MGFIDAMDEDGLACLVALADAAGDAIMSIYAKCDKDLHATTKADNSPLTAADAASNEILLRGLRARWPQIPILSEESENTFAEGDKPNLYWAVDPLDGTKEFIKGNGEFTVNIALVMQGKPQVGVIGAPALGIMYAGVVGGFPNLPVQAKKRGTAGWTDINVSNRSPEDGTDEPLRAAVSRSHPSDQLLEWLAKYPAIKGQDIGSSLKFCWVAEGAVDVYPRLGPTSIWDTAAGHALVLAAGGDVKQTDGAPLLYAEPAKTLNPFFVAWGTR